ncbi:G-protein coupled receptors family 1 profile domain-containing protein [Caenorhabditis elegans]|uniref:G-protein coupled receptors family 1 profile domain-containing protein n=1 Tax=Caenorhabditis elegans TaxID=6239 RepID=U4PLH7_CAEEL|nr:G-protein coupled receptors family 1 profile domain-containing protein [Caenorhabditis elegans]CDH92956.1 G-protein coupled receptors family 1 profile domain-containing protein [Caenorhabditis elegans]|eukprot:NP_001294262.1 SERotonin/octopamine receptor family [Caenorhabditis elegans]
MILLSLTLGVVNCFVVIGNLLVFYVILTKKSLQTSTNHLVLSLTISDLLLGILILPFAIIQEHSNEWIFGHFGCRLWLSVDVFLSTASIYNLLAISFDRYMAVRQPIKYPIISSTKVVRLMTFLVWFCSLLLAVILFVLLTLNAHDSEPTKDCQPTSLPSMYIIFSAMASFIVPAFVMVILNVRIFQTVLHTSRTMTVKSKNGSLRVHRRKEPIIPVKKHDKYETRLSHEEECVGSPSKEVIDPIPVVAVVEKHHKSSAVDAPAIRSFLTHTVVFGVLEAKKTNIINHITQKKCMRRSLRTEIRVARTTGIVVAAFIVCWIPFTTIYVLQAYAVCTVAAGCIPASLFTTAFWLGYSNSAVNPILYAAFSRDFRIALKRLFFQKPKF